jgi:hypothetical protein
MICFLNLAVAGCCAAIVGLELHAGHYPSAFAYGGFALGYIGLAWLYGSLA